ncbi:galectin-2 isoform X2 [Ailuropoda melanoleuca]|uniref:galectin-2 isoform X2 n=1 Tax=Ailuropoda melanoleuca TaxID=9646 RepID=UPI000947AABD|nr:galectin-2 isoform X2 [Ailuropoda melanoleuca]
MSGKFEMTNMDMKLGTTLKIKGKIASDADGFVINLGQGSEKLNLHFNPRFRDSVIVCNSREGRWGQEQRVRGQDLRDLWEGRIRSEAARRAPADLSQQAGPQPHQLPERAGRAEGLFLQD